LGLSPEQDVYVRGDLILIASGRACQEVIIFRFLSHTRTIAADYTKFTPEVEFPYIRRVYSLYGAADKVQNAHFPREKHDYGPSKRMAAYPFFIRYLELDGERPWEGQDRIDESFVTVETREEMLVFGLKDPYPKDAVKPNTPLPH
jgi:uncharacterized protein